MNFDQTEFTQVLQTIRELRARQLPVILVVGAVPIEKNDFNLAFFEKRYGHSRLLFTDLIDP